MALRDPKRGSGEPRGPGLTVGRKGQRFARAGLGRAGFAGAGLAAALLAAFLGLGGGDGAADADADGARPFDYYVLALTWSPSFCRDNAGSDQCGRGARFLVHGLWPNREDGWDADCPTSQAPPSRALLGGLSDITPGPGLMAYQWRRHGACSGLSAPRYFEALRAAHDSVAIPPVLDALDRDVTLPASVVEEAFLEANPDMVADGVTVTCKSGRIAEVRVCLTPELEPRACAAAAARDCRSRNAALPAPL